MNKKNTNKAKALIKSCLNGQKRLIFLNCILSSLVSAAYILLAMLSKSLIDIATSSANGKFYIYVLFMSLTVLLQLLLNTFHSHFATVTSGKMSIALRSRIFNLLYEKEYKDVSSYHSGELLNRFLSDSDVVVGTASSIIPSICSTVTKLVAGIFALITLDWRFGSGIIIIGIFIPLIAKMLTAKYKKLHKAYQVSNGKIKSYFQELLVNLPVVKSFTSLNPVKSKLGGLLKENYGLKLKKNWLSIFTASGFYTFFTAGYFLVLIWGAIGIQNETVTYGSLIAFLQIISQLKTPLQSISGFLPQYSSMLASAERICELEDIEDELLPMNENMLAAVRDIFEGIKAENLSFSYGEKSILEDCNFYIPRDSIAVITGESGHGKSTLFKLLLGYFKPNGRLTLNNNYEINASTRGLFSYVPQGNMILSGTILENLTICTTDASEEKISSAIEIAVLKEWIDSLPDGINTKIGENGLGISEGQAQRIAIARALICDTPILLLDEATCSLDNATEHTLLWNLKELPDKTVLLVTHRKVEDGIADITLHLDNKQFTQTNA